MEAVVQLGIASLAELHDRLERCALRCEPGRETTRSAFLVELSRQIAIRAPQRLGHDREAGSTVFGCAIPAHRCAERRQGWDGAPPSRLVRAGGSDHTCGRRDLGRVVDQKVGDNFGRMQVTDSVTNSADFRAAVSVWAKRLVQGLDKLRAGETPGS